MKKRKKRPITLLEVMIVILLIGIIGGVIGYNMLGSVDEGRAFKSEQGVARIRDILLLEMARKDLTLQDTCEKFEEHLKNSGLVKDVDKFVKDGWGIKYEVGTTANGEIEVTSQGLQAYRAKKGFKNP